MREQALCAISGGPFGPPPPARELDYFRRPIWVPPPARELDYFRRPICPPPPPSGMCTGTIHHDTYSSSLDSPITPREFIAPFIPLHATPTIFLGNNRPLRANEHDDVIRPPSLAWKNTFKTKIRLARILCSFRVTEVIFLLLEKGSGQRGNVYVYVYIYLAVPRLLSILILILCLTWRVDLHSALRGSSEQK